MIPENGRFSRFEPRKRGSEPRFRGSKRAGISRVKRTQIISALRTNTQK